MLTLLPSSGSSSFLVPPSLSLPLPSPLHTSFLTSTSSLSPLTPQPRPPPLPASFFQSLKLISPPVPTVLQQESKLRSILEPESACMGLILSARQQLKPTELGKKLCEGGGTIQDEITCLVSRGGRGEALSQRMSPLSFVESSSTSRRSWHSQTLRVIMRIGSGWNLELIMRTTYTMYT